MNNVITIDFLGGYSKMQTMQNEFMHAADVFEQSKELVMHDRTTLITSDLEKTLASLHENYKKSVEQVGGYVIFIGICHVNGKEYKDTNCFFKEGVRSVSMLQKGTLGWGVFKDILTKLGYDVVTTNDMKVIKVN